MKIKAPSHATVVAYLALFFAMGGTAVAATGGTFVLGRNNAASTQTRLTNIGSGPVLALGTQPGQAPLAVSANSGKATNLNADALDGIDSSQFQRTIGRACPAGQAVTAIGADGSLTCAQIGSSAPAGSPTPSPSPTGSQQTGTLSDKGFTLSDLTLGPDSVNQWDGTGRITNNNAGTKSAQFTITVFRNGAIVTTLSGTVNSLAAGATYTTRFVDSDTYTPGPYTFTFQTDVSFDG